MSLWPRAWRWLTNSVVNRFSLPGGKLAGRDARAPGRIVALDKVWCSREGDELPREEYRLSQMKFHELDFKGGPYPNDRTRAIKADA